MRLEKLRATAETARSLRRTVHTLKGDAAACGFRELSELAHEFEDVLTLENPAAAALVPEIALRAADVFAALLESYQKGTKTPASKRCERTLPVWRRPEAAGGAMSKQRKRKRRRKSAAGPNTSKWRLPGLSTRASGFTMSSCRSTRSAPCPLPDGR